MTSNTPDSIELRAAREQDDEFFYLGYSMFPGKEAVKKSLANGHLYKPQNFYPNEDDSMTAEWLQPSFGFNKTERKQNFYKYVADLVIPQLEDVLGMDVEFNGELEPVRLQLTEVEFPSSPEQFKVTRIRLGSMSLFQAKATLAPAEKKVA